MFANLLDALPVGCIYATLGERKGKGSTAWLTAIVDANNHTCCRGEVGQWVDKYERSRAAIFAVRVADDCRNRYQIGLYNLVEHKGVSSNMLATIYIYAVADFCNLCACGMGGVLEKEVFALI